MENGPSGSPPAGANSASVAAWNGKWQGSLDASVPDLETPSLENDIDRLKLDFLLPLLPRAGRAVEIGCGSARLLARVGRATALELYAVDTSSAALEVARNTSRAIGIPIHCVESDARELVLESASFDLVLSGGLLEHFPDPRPVLAEMIRILKPGGVFYADVVPRKLSLYRRGDLLRMLRSPWMLPGVYESAFGAAYYRNALTELGCRDVTSHGAGIYPPGNPRWWLGHTKRFDGTAVADWLGWYFMLSARRGPLA
jgi:SAM-dependent methyltransferase